MMKTSSKLIRLSVITMLLALVAMLLLPGAALAASGIFAGGITVNVRSGGSTDYAVASFNGTDLGTIGCGQSLLFVGGYVDTYKNSGSNVTGASINYRVYPQGSPSGTYTIVTAPWLCNKPSGECSGFGNDGDQRWRQSSGNTDIANGLGPGTYTIEVYSQATSTDGSHFLNNGGNNYKATFTVLTRSNANTGNWNSGSTWVGGAVPATNANVEICSGSTVTLDTDPTVRSVKINSGGTLLDDSTANTLTVAGTSTVNPSFTNNGAFSAGSGTVAFAGQNNINGRVWGSTATAFNNVTISYNGSGSGGTDVFGADFYDQSTSQRATVNGILTINPRGFVANAENGSTGTACSSRDCGTPIYGSSSTLKYNDLEYPEGEPSSCPGTSATVPFQTYAEWLNQTSSPGVPQNVIVGSDSWVSFNCNQGTSYRANGDFTVQAGVDGNTYGGSGTTPAGFEQNGFNLGTIGSSTLTLGSGKDVANNGTLKQSGTPTASGTTSFINIKDTGGTSLYYGVDIVNGSALGFTTVKVSGNQDTCPYVNAGSRPVKRCYYFNVTNAASPQVVFYYEYAELRSGQDPSTLNVWKDNGNGTWTKITPSARSACTSGINCSVTVSSLSEEQGPLMVAGANRYVIQGTNPQAVTMADFSAAQTGDAVLLTWETNSELENRGFNLYRGTDPSAPDRQLNDALIPSQSQGNPGGFIYTWEDRADLVPGTTYFYWVEDVDIYGVATRHGPVSVDYGAPTAVRLLDAGAATALPLALPALGAGVLALAAAVAWRRRR
jgi:hypothetical protein